MGRLHHHFHLIRTINSFEPQRRYHSDQVEEDNDTKRPTVRQCNFEDSLGYQHAAGECNAKYIYPDIIAIPS